MLSEIFAPTPVDSVGLLGQEATGAGYSHTYRNPQPKSFNPSSMNAPSNPRLGRTAAPPTNHVHNTTNHSRGGAGGASMMMNDHHNYSYSPMTGFGGTEGQRLLVAAAQRLQALGPDGGMTSYSTLNRKKGGNNSKLHASHGAPVTSGFVEPRSGNPRAATNSASPVTAGSPRGANHGGGASVNGERKQAVFGGRGSSFGAVGGSSIGGPSTQAQQGAQQQQGKPSSATTAPAAAAANASNITPNTFVDQVELVPLRESDRGDLSLMDTDVLDNPAAAGTTLTASEGGKVRPKSSDDLAMVPVDGANDGAPMDTDDPPKGNNEDGQEEPQPSRDLADARSSSPSGYAPAQDANDNNTITSGGDGGDGVVRKESRIANVVIVPASVQITKVHVPTPSTLATDDHLRDVLGGGGTDGVRLPDGTMMTTTATTTTTTTTTAPMMLDNGPAVQL